MKERRKEGNGRIFAFARLAESGFEYEDPGEDPEEDPEEDSME